MTYTVLARRYRSRSFEQVVGQEPIALTLRNAIDQGKVHHAFLFTGTRGVGKTSMARILAAALNAPATVPDCPPPKDADAYPPQDVQQRMAEAIMRGDDMNVIEIDGASNRKVEEARQLLEGTGLTPTGQARYKIYIIDEVHMLTRESFNTLLKTLEEPPGHVKFILCTTEAHNVPATIQSRCQRFDFRNIPTSRITAHLREVLETEKFEGDDQVLWQVARLANGSMRDALSLLDRLIAAAGRGQPLSPQLLEQMLGLPPQEAVVRLVDALAEGQVGEALIAAAGLVDSGLSQDQVIEALVDRLRQLMLLAACGADSDVVELADEAREQAVAQAARFDAAGVVHMIALCENLQRSSRLSSHPRALFDATIVRLALAEKMADVVALLAGAPRPEPKKKERPAPESPARRLTDVAPSSRPQVTPASMPAAAPQAKARAESAPPATADDADAGQVWQRLLERVADKASMSWIRSFQLQKFESDNALLVPVPGRRELLGFVTPSRRDQLAALFAGVVGRPVRVELAAAATQQVEESCDQADESAGGRMDQERAFDLPMVRQVLDQFDATVVDARSRKKDSGSSDPPAEGG